MEITTLLVLQQYVSPEGLCQNQGLFQGRTYPLPIIPYHRIHLQNMHHLRPSLLVITPQSILPLIIIMGIIQHIINLHIMSHRQGIILKIHMHTTLSTQNHHTCYLIGLPRSQQFTEPILLLTNINIQPYIIHHQ